MYAKQANITTAQALNTLSEMSSQEAAQLPEGLSFIQLRNLLEAIEGAEFILTRLRRATEQHIGWLEEVGEESPTLLELPQEFVAAA